MAGKLCKCGCGETVKPGNIFVRGHNSRYEHPRLGVKISEETRKKLSESHKGPRPWRLGKKLSAEACKKMSKAHKGVPLSESHRKGITTANRKSWERLSDIEKSERHAKMWVPFNGSSPMKDKSHTDEANLKNREAHLKLWEDPDHARKCLVFNSPNKCEIKLLKILESMYPGEWKFVGDGQVIIDGKCPDFININGRKQIIELYGERWHQNDDPQDRIKVFKPFGYDTIVIWVKELQNTKKLKRRLESFCQGYPGSSVFKERRCR